MSETPEANASVTLTEAQWAEAKGLYETGRMTKAAIARHFGAHRNTIQNGLASRGAVYGSKSKEIEDATVESAKSDSAKLASEIAAMKIERKRDVELLAKLQRKAMSEALRDGKPLSSKADEFRVLNTMLKNTKLVREELWEIYDLNRDPDGADEIPEFIVSEYTPDEVDLINKERLGIVGDDQALEVLEAAAEAAGDALDSILDETP